MKSEMIEIGSVTFPEFTNETTYMRPFVISEGLPRGFEKWQLTVDRMLAGLKLKAGTKAFLTIDQRGVKAGTAHRRPGLHIDGNWIENDWKTGGGWKPIGMHSTTGGYKLHGDSQILILASNVVGCVAYEGEYEASPGEGGDYSHLDVTSLQCSELQSSVAYAGKAMEFLHESIPLQISAQRTLVRLNVAESL